MKVQKFGFQDQEDGTILEGEERSVGKSYVSTGAFGSVTYSPSTKLQRKHLVIKVELFELPLYFRRSTISS
ncbi:hypothetical protein J40TS1_22390 [Paenibacillus montaniterrae]|uniref:Uncharacterized protein n=1 Tax=Paenibacillus montaniterrae TaxID=429341 RepID=A0A920CU40_9BACL|nr:hypothetical protein J40TS1_22390 [Paenibacillus montaniterrae]